MNGSDSINVTLLAGSVDPYSLVYNDTITLRPSFPIVQYAALPTDCSGKAVIIHSEEQIKTTIENNASLILFEGNAPEKFNPGIAIRAPNQNQARWTSHNNNNTTTIKARKQGICRRRCWARKKCRSIEDP
jgi:hypothetical protein